MTVTAWPPGLMVIVVATDARPLTVIVIVAFWPACSVPDEGDSVSLPSRLDDSVADQFTGPPTAVIVIEPPRSGESSTLVGDTVRVPGATAAEVDGGGGDEEAEGDGEADGDLDRVGVAPGLGLARGLDVAPADGVTSTAWLGLDAAPALRVDAAPAEVLEVTAAGAELTTEEVVPAAATLPWR